MFQVNLRLPMILRQLTGFCQRRSEEHTSELQSQSNLVCRLLLEKKKNVLLVYHARELLHSLCWIGFSQTYADNVHSDRASSGLICCLQLAGLLCHYVSVPDRSL